MSIEFQITRVRTTVGELISLACSDDVSVDARKKLLKLANEISAALNGEEPE